MASFLLGLPDELTQPIHSADENADAQLSSEDGDEQNENDHEATIAKTLTVDMSDQRPTAMEMLPPVRTQRPKSNKRVKGGRAPSFKPIRVELDAEDQLIFDKKQAGYSLDDIVQSLVDEGFTSYKPKSVNCRYLRILKKRQAYEEALLDANLADWHVGEDALLLAAVAKADEKYAEHLAKLKKSRWTWTAQEINKTPSTLQRFSARACRERFEAIKNGTSICPPELDSDPERRARKHADDLATFKQRQKEKAEKDAAAAEEKKRIKKETSIKAVASRQRNEMRAQTREQKKQDEESYRLAKAQACEKAKLRREAALEAHRSQRRYEDNKQRVLKALQKKLRKELDARLKKAAKYAGLPEGSDIPADPKKRYQYKNTREEIAENIEKDIEATEAAIQARALAFNNEAVTIPVEVAEPSASSTPQPTTDPNAVSDPADPFQNEDPRNMCTIPELQQIMRLRGMILNRMKEAKPVMVARLYALDKDMTISELRAMLLKRGAAITGSKDALVRRVAEEDAKTSVRYQNKFMPTFDENGKKIIMKIVKPVRDKYEQRYNARDGPSDFPKTTKVAAVTKTTKKAPVRKTPSKAVVRTLSGEYVHDSQESSQVDQFATHDASNAENNMDLDDVENTMDHDNVQFSMDHDEEDA